MYVLALGRKKNRHFFEGGDPPWPPRKNVVGQKKKSKNIFALDPKFLLYNNKVLYKGRPKKTIHKDYGYFLLLNPSMK